MLKLYIGNKNYSSWSMRPWVLLRQAGIPFEEVMVRFDAFTPDSSFKQRLGKISPAGRVPVLVDGDLVIWDTLAIAEYVAEYVAEYAVGYAANVATDSASTGFAAKPVPLPALWPTDRAARARARSVCAEMHSGFNALRGACPMNIEADLRIAGQIIQRDRADVRQDLARIDAMWSELLAEHGGPMLFGDFSIADAYFAPVCMRISAYGLSVSPAVLTYVERVKALPGVAAWIAQAKAEKDFLDFEEPYRTAHPHTADLHSADPHSASLY